MNNTEWKKSTAYCNKKTNFHRFKQDPQESTNAG